MIHTDIVYTIGHLASNYKGSNYYVKNGYRVLLGYEEIVGSIKYYGALYYNKDAKNDGIIVFFQGMLSANEAYYNKSFKIPMLKSLHELDFKYIFVTTSPFLKSIIFGIDNSVKARMVYQVFCQVKKCIEYFKINGDVNVIGISYGTILLNEFFHESKSNNEYKSAMNFIKTTTFCSGPRSHVHYCFNAILSHTLHFLKLKFFLNLLAKFSKWSWGLCGFKTQRNDIMNLQDIIESQEYRERNCSSVITSMLECISHKVISYHNINFCSISEVNFVYEMGDYGIDLMTVLLNFLENEQSKNFCISNQLDKSSNGHVQIYKNCGNMKYIKNLIINVKDNNDMFIRPLH